MLNKNIVPTATQSPRKKSALSLQSWILPNRKSQELNSTSQTITQDFYHWDPRPTPVTSTVPCSAASTLTRAHDRSISYFQETLVQGLLSDVQNFRVVNAAIVKDLLDDEPKGEGRDIQHVQQCGFAGTHFVSSLDQLHITLRNNTDNTWASKDVTPELL